MQTLPRSASEGRPGITADSTRHPATGSKPLTPAQRVALTIALLNQGFDVVDQVARTCLTGCARRMGRSRTAADDERRTGASRRMAASHRSVANMPS